jgi:signal transduction histidine kinase
MLNLHNQAHAVQDIFRPSRFFRKLNLQGRFLLILGLSSLIVTLLLWLVFNSFTEHLLERFGAQLAEKQMLYDRERTLRPLIREISLAHESADSTLLRLWAKNEFDPDIRQRAIEKLEKMRNHFRGGNYYLAFTGSRNYYHNDAEGRYDGRQLRYTLDQSDPNDAWFFDFVERGEEKRIRVARNDKLGVSKIWVRVPILDGDKVIGVLGTGIDLDDFAKNVSGHRQPGVTNMFINQDAVIQVHNDVGHIEFPGVRNQPDHTHSGSQIISEDSGKKWLHQAIKALDRDEKIVDTEFVIINEKRYLAGLIALPEVGWYDLTLLDLSVLLPKTDFIGLLATAIGGALLLIGSLAFALHRLVLKPVSGLSDSMARIQRGEYNHMPISADESAGEVNTLTKQLLHMENAVHSTQLWMESEINKRTQLLVDAQNVLKISLEHEQSGREIQAAQMAVMAHEMRSPLAVIGNTAQMLRLQANSEHPEWLPRINKILGSVHQLVAMTDDFLSEKWLGMGSHGLKRSYGNLNQLCTRLIANIAGSRERQIRFKPLAGDASLHADWQLLQIAITNLLDNACKYSYIGSEVSLEVSSHRAGWLCIEVSDDGAGIPELLQPHIFEKYSRGEHSTQIQGSGIGLYLVNWIAEFHDGYMEVTSKEGAGSIFHFCLPIHESNGLSSEKLQGQLGMDD